MWLLCECIVRVCVNGVETLDVLYMRLTAVSVLPEFSSAWCCILLVNCAYLCVLPIRFSSLFNFDFHCNLNVFFLFDVPIFAV